MDERLQKEQIKMAFRGILSFNPVLASSSEWNEWTTREDERTCYDCTTNNGKVRRFSHNWKTSPPVHPNCRCEIRPMGTIAAGTATADGESGVDSYVINNGMLPDYYINKQGAFELGWKPSENNLDDIAPGKVVGGDVFNNFSGKLPDEPGRVWYEADIATPWGTRGVQRIIYSSDGLVFVTYDHYETFFEITPPKNNIKDWGIDFRKYAEENNIDNMDIELVAGEGFAIIARLTYNGKSNDFKAGSYIYYDKDRAYFEKDEFLQFIEDSQIVNIWEMESQVNDDRIEFVKYVDGSFWATVYVIQYGELLASSYYITDSMKELIDNPKDPKFNLDDKTISIIEISKEAIMTYQMNGEVFHDVNVGSDEYYALVANAMHLRSLFSDNVSKQFHDVATFVLVAGAITNGIVSGVRNAKIKSNIEASSKTGKYIDNTNDSITSAEKKVIDDLVEQGKTVERIAKDPKSIDKTPDFKVDGVKTELKTLQNANTNTGMKRIQEGFKQGADTVIIDTRGSGLTKSQANEIISRVSGKYPDGNLPGAVEIWIDGEIIIY